MSKPAGSFDGKKLAMIVVAALCLAAAGYMVYQNFAEPTPPSVPSKPEDLKTSEPAPLPPNVNRPKPG